ncbi:DUF2750 domain-containing protein [Acinetobacter variabilis]|uniref:Uncharacterized protein n=1 Tax=Acinetobacter variabilis TaxID=70346 RepID=N9NLZ9_9GAMM|nr:MULTISPECIES: DUF2750 domain-containing protein [Acinetobacter]EXA68252.1 hypothetical protein J504_0426 [Acinetobacter baumannii 348935]AUX88828.1 DUF2750 domain-containing protein [Acinetobacter sp. ACNIH1]ENX06706.1 hypothetical protein F897_02983 [Acinetobacter variabilis]MCU4629817.1 DUF2750 domain-containing protein [Acinetobacter variabilis]QXR20081.1 DUF2750 domain-containing protein [Acinetobacter variabilis]
MRNPYQRKAAIKSQNTAYDPLQVYKNFIEAIVTQGGIFALYQEGWALCATPTGQRAFATWQSKGLARLLIKDNWANYQIQEITLKDFVEKVIPFLRQESTIVSLDLTPEGQNILVAPEKLLLDLKNYLYQVYVQKPELFKNPAIPSPRHIRLN